MAPNLEISALITAHNEADLVERAVRSAREALDEVLPMARGELLVLLDSPTEETVAAVERVRGLIGPVVTIEKGDPAAARNAAAESAKGTYVAFLDADDMWSSNWLTSAITVARAGGDECAVHPEYNVFYGTRQLIIDYPSHPDACSPLSVVLSNPWTVNMLVSRDLVRRLPFSEGVEEHEDWRWQLESRLSGVAHYIAPGTVHFIRGRAGSVSARRIMSGATVSFEADERDAVLDSIKLAPEAATRAESV